MTLNRDEFLNALANGQLTPTVETEQQPTTGIILVGIVKLAEGEDRHILFSPVTCLNWFDLPVEIIEEVEPLGKIPCRDHKHDLVLIQLKEPSTPEAKLLANVLRHTSELLSDIKEANETEFKQLTVEPEESMPEAAAFNLAGFRAPRISVPRIPPIVIPPIVPGQVDRISRFSSCAKCKLGVEIILSALIAGAFAAAGAGTGPSALAALKLALESEFGAAAAEAALSAAFSHNNTEAAKIICRVHGKC